MKKLSVVVAGTGQIKDIELSPALGQRHLGSTRPSELPASKGPNYPFLCGRRVDLRQR